MKRLIATLWLACGASGTALVGMPLPALAPSPNPSPPRTAIPYVPTQHDGVKDLLWMAGVSSNDVVYDLGSGDGRIVIAAVRDFGARRAVGYEVDRQLVQESRANAAEAGVANRVQFLQGDLFTNDFSEASVAVLYLGQAANLDLRAKLVRSLKPGARVLSHQFGMGEWPADKLLDVRTVHLGMYGEAHNEFRTNPEVPDYSNLGNGASHDVLLAWTVPAPVAGTWRGKLLLESKEAELRLTLHQRLSGIAGSFQIHGTSNLGGGVRADLWGDHVRCLCFATNQGFPRFQMWFDGHADAETLNGRLWVPHGDETRESNWIGLRDKTDFTGTWEWPGPSGSAAQLRIERRHGQLAATYVDSNRRAIPNRGGSRSIPVTDFYDFGGGFYFTLLLGLEGASLRGPRRAGPDDGWLIGEAVAQENGLTGTIAFYGYGARVPIPTVTQTQRAGPYPVPREGRREWQPKRVAP